MRAKRSSSGMTMVEILVVVVMMAILVAVWGVNRQSQIRSAFMLEADMLVADIINKQKIYFAKDGRYDAVLIATSNYAIGNLEKVNTEKNQYFKTFTISSDTSQGFIITVFGATGTEVQGLKRRVKYDGKTGTETPLSSED